MSARYAPVAWNRTKLLYDAVALAAVAVYLHAYTAWSPAARAADAALDGPSLAMAAWGSCAFLLLTVTLAIGPLARLDRRFLPLLYNRRHLGVITATVATGHALHVLGWYFAFSPVPALEALLAADAGFGQARGVPFIPFGIAALLILWTLAATSHDFWLAFLGPPLWKAIHLSVYAAYALIVAHVAFGALQDARAPALPLLTATSAAALVALHLAAALRTRREARSGPARAPAAAVPPRAPDAVAPEAQGSAPSVDRDAVSRGAPADVAPGAQRAVAPGAQGPAQPAAPAAVAPGAAPEAPWVVVAALDEIAEGRGVVAALPGRGAAAVFRYQGRLSAVANACAHQNGPLGEGRVLDGCVTCPWHGYQYRLTDGRAPAPFTERIATYRLKLDGRRVLIDPRPNPPGAYVEPVVIPEDAA
jgi:nitrite reductase/ring-hydroxylating ferredoxin subunit/DMSO/TMAO reductase YedYZ heme-binding membrane subunit